MKNSQKQTPNSNSDVFFVIFHWNLEFVQVRGYPQLELNISLTPTKHSIRFRGNTGGGIQPHPPPTLSFLRLKNTDYENFKHTHKYAPNRNIHYTFMRKYPRANHQQILHRNHIHTTHLQNQPQ